MGRLWMVHLYLHSIEIQPTLWGFQDMATLQHAAAPDFDLMGMGT